MQPPHIPSRIFHHSPLRNDISTRLLTLLPGSSEDYLSCLIKETAEDSKQQYEALSYAWGDPVISHVVMICDYMVNDEWRPFPITQNLYEALCRLRDPHMPRKLWIDALCINQDDLQEKGHQVAHMGRIYREATCVVVWLGEEDMYPLTRTAFHELKNHQKHHFSAYTYVGEIKKIPW